jgi:acetyl esterase/lipase
MELPLYAGDIPNSLPAEDREAVSIRQSDGRQIVTEVSRPTLTVFPAAAKAAIGAAVIVLPGGGYTMLSNREGGSHIAARFAELGIAAFLLKYRLPSDRTMSRREIGPVQDVQRALEVVRARAAEWGVARDRVGLVGCSAGGHLAAFAGTRFDQDFGATAPGANRRPDFLTLLYPVISFDDGITHLGTRTALIGERPAPERIAAYSADLLVSARTPPTFLVHGLDDSAVSVRNSARFLEALQRHDVACAMHLYERGEHGFGAVNPASPVGWIELAARWVGGLFR